MEAKDKGMDEIIRGGLQNNDNNGNNNNSNRKTDRHWEGQRAQRSRRTCIYKVIEEENQRVFGPQFCLHSVTGTEIFFPFTMLRKGLFKSGQEFSVTAKDVLDLVYLPHFLRAIPPPACVGG